MLNFKIKSGELEAIDDGLYYKIFPALNGNFYLYIWEDEKLIHGKEVESVLSAINLANAIKTIRNEV